MDVEGCIIYDKGLTPQRRGRIVSVNADGTVTVDWERNTGVSTLHPEPGRYDVVCPQQVTP